METIDYPLSLTRDVQWIVLNLLTQASQRAIHTCAADKVIIILYDIYLVTVLLLLVVHCFVGSDFQEGALVKWYAK